MSKKLGPRCGLSQAEGHSRGAKPRVRARWGVSFVHFALVRPKAAVPRKPPYWSGAQAGMAARTKSFSAPLPRQPVAYPIARVARPGRPSQAWRRRAWRRGSVPRHRAGQSRASWLGKRRSPRPSSVRFPPLPRRLKFARPNPPPCGFRSLLDAGIVTTEIDVGDSPAVYDHPLAEVHAGRGASSYSSLVAVSV